MGHVQQSNENRFFSLLLYILGFLLFWEWLRPLSVISKGTDVSYFVSFAAFSFLLSYLRLPYWASFPAKLLGMGYALHILYFYNTPILDPLWLHYFFEDFSINFSFMIHGNWEGMTDLFRSFLFFVLLWIVSYLMHYWLIQARRLFLFFFVTIIYLTVLDSFTMYHADGAIVRTMIIGLVLIGLLRLIRVQEQEGVIFERGRWPFSWFVGLCLLIVLTLLVGLAAPKVGPQWPDPVPFITKAANGYGDSSGGSGSGGKRIGYGTDDTRLGGAFQMDDTLVFTATTQNAHYWKIETRDTYTGKGWATPANQFKTLNSMTSLNANTILKRFGPDTKTIKQTDTIQMKLPSFPQLAYGGEISSVSGINANQLRVNQISGKIEPELRGRIVTPKTYTVTYQYPTFSVPLLKEVKASANDPEDIKVTDLQLPSDVPARVKALAEKLTGPYSNRYDKAQAIVNYFNTNGYEYNTQDVPYPSKGQDYVDQFLFDSKVGYCDNFSTSMVVLLRSVGIPARWVKGFSEGTYQSSTTQASKFDITESDAHSWVEVYFPGTGWVPFEPTVGFTNPANFSYTEPSGSQNKSSTTAQQKQKSQTNTNNQKQPKPNQLQHNNPTTQKGSHALLSGLSFKQGFWLAVLAVLILMIAVFVLFRTRRKWLPIWWKRRFGHRKDEEALDEAFEKLMKLLALSGYRKKENQTLREFARDVDRRFGTFEMSKLVRQMEKRRYSSQSNSTEWAESKELWENMINRIRA